MVDRQTPKRRRSDPAPELEAEKETTEDLSTEQPAKRSRTKSSGKAESPKPRSSKSGSERKASSQRAKRTRQERSLQTRQALLDAALNQLEDHNFGGLSMREVARAAGITPTAFYRHFDSMEELGLVLVDDSFRALREMLRTGRQEATDMDDAIKHPVGVLVSFVPEHRTHFRFIGRERFGGKSVLRRAISHEIRLFSSEVATDLARYPVLRELETETLQMMASMIVSMMVATVEELIDLPPGRPELVELVKVRAEQQLTMIVLGATRWNEAVGSLVGKPNA